MSRKSVLLYVCVDPFCSLFSSGVVPGVPSIPSFLDKFICSPFFCFKTTGYSVTIQDFVFKSLRVPFLTPSADSMPASTHLGFSAFRPLPMPRGPSRPPPIDGHLPSFFPVSPWQLFPRHPVSPPLIQGTRSDAFSPAYSATISRSP